MVRIVDMVSDPASADQGTMSIATRVLLGRPCIEVSVVASTVVPADLACIVANIAGQVKQVVARMEIVSLAKTRPAIGLRRANVVNMVPWEIIQWVLTTPGVVLVQDVGLIPHTWSAA